MIWYVLSTKDVQCSRASQPTFKIPHLELPELQNSVLCIPLTVLSEKEVIYKKSFFSIYGNRETI